MSSLAQPIRLSAATTNKLSHNLLNLHDRPGTGRVLLGLFRVHGRMPNLTGKRPK